MQGIDRPADAAFANAQQAGNSTDVTDCNCSICRRYGVRWAYYSPR